VETQSFPIEGQNFVRDTGVSRVSHVRSIQKDDARIPKASGQFDAGTGGTPVSRTSEILDKHTLKIERHGLAAHAT
jgi:hypothetical protein